MLEPKKRSFFERITGSIRLPEEREDSRDLRDQRDNRDSRKLAVKGEKDDKKNPGWMEEENEEMELAVDVYQTPTDIIVQTMVAGVKPEDLEINIARDMITIRGKREEMRNIDEENYFTKELYWGTFSRTILLPQEIEPEEAEATEKQGLLTIRLQKIDKEKRTTVRVKAI